MKAEHIGAVFRRRRLAKGVTLIPLAKRCGYDQSNLSRMERGLSSPSIDMMVQICRVLNLTLSEVIREAEVYAAKVKK